MLDFRQTVEVETLHELLPQLNHYRLLTLTPGCTQSRVEEAYRRESRAYHPDRFYGLENQDLLEKINDIYARINESYAVLKVAGLRAFYDRLIDEFPDKGGLGKDELEMLRDAQRNPTQAIKHPKAKRFYDLALKARDAKDWNGTVMNLQFALGFEQGNTVLETALEQARARLEEVKKAKATEGNYRIKIIPD